MSKHLYCCQNVLQNLHDHIIPIPGDIKINPMCLTGINESEFIDSLRNCLESSEI